MVNDNYGRGFERLKEIDGEAGERVIESLKDISPDFARYLIEFPFGDIYSRTGLDLKSSWFSESEFAYSSIAS